MASSGDAPTTSTKTPASVPPGASADHRTIGSRLRETLTEFASADPRTLGLFRVLFGVFLLVDWYRRLPDYVLFLTNDGILPAHASISRPMSPYLFSVFHIARTPHEVALALALTGVVYTLYLVGYRTKLMQVLVLLLVTSLHSRNILLENGGDVVANLLAMWTLFLPVGKRFSVDALRESLDARKEKRPDELNDGRTPRGTTTPTVSLAYAAAILNCAFIYYFNAIHKDGIPWKTGTTVHYVLWSDRLIQPLGIWVRGLLPPSGVFGLTVGTLVIESSIAALLFSPIWIRPCRRVAALLIIALHCGLQTVGHFGLFAFVMMLHAPLFLGREDWEALERRWAPRLSRRVVVYDADCGVCFLVARIVRRLDPDRRIRFVPNDDPESFPASVNIERVEQTMVVTDEAGTASWEEEAAIAQILRCLPYGVLGARLIELPGIRQFVRILYQSFAARRKYVSEALGYGACGIPLRISGSDRTVGTRAGVFFPIRLGAVLRESLAALMILAVGVQLFHENRLAPAILKPQKPPRFLLALAEYPRCFQGWSMFAPIPPLEEGTLVVDAVTADGRHIDPTRSGGPVDFSMPDVDHGLLVSQFWYEFADRIRRDGNTRFRDYFRDWILASHRLENRPRDRIVSFEASWVSRPTQPPFQRFRRATSKKVFLTYPETDKRPTRTRLGPGGSVAPTPPARDEQRHPQGDAHAAHGDGHGDETPPVPMPAVLPSPPHEDEDEEPAKP
jgi:predicted DCC family thiol-disulfide oxidoreductase YuxK